MIRDTHRRDKGHMHSSGALPFQPTRAHSYLEFRVRISVCVIVLFDKLRLKIRSAERNVSLRNSNSYLFLDALSVFIDLMPNA